MYLPCMKIVKLLAKFGPWHYSVSSFSAVMASSRGHPSSLPVLCPVSLELFVSVGSPSLVNDPNRDKRRKATQPIMPTLGCTHPIESTCSWTWRDCTELMQADKPRCQYVNDCECLDISHLEKHMCSHSTEATENWNDRMINASVIWHQRRLWPQGFFHSANSEWYDVLTLSCQPCYPNRHCQLLLYPGPFARSAGCLSKHTSCDMRHMRHIRAL